MQEFLHKCLILVEAMGLEAERNVAQSLINKEVLLILRQYFVTMF